MNSRDHTGTRAGWLQTFFVLVLVLSMAASPGAVSESASGAAGERLTYTLRWGPVRAGKATLEFVGRAEVNGCQVLHFLSTIETDSFVAAIYGLRNRLDGFTDPALSRSLLYRRNQEEGGELSEAQAVFDTEQNTATYCKVGRRCRKPIAIRPDTFDPVACIFHFRKLSLEGVSETRIHVSDGKTAVWVSARIIGREPITTPAGTFSTLKVEALIERGRDRFKRDQKTRVLVWFTDNQERLPVMGQGELVLGPFTAELIEISRPAPKGVRSSGPFFGQC
jgi:hypothetical protein